MNALNDSTQPPGTERVFAYFLGELPAAEADLFEREVFESESLAEQVFALEEELIEAYLHGGLPPERRARFEQHYLTTEERRERVEFVAALDDELSAASAPPLHQVEAKASWWQTFFFTPRLAWSLLLLFGVTAGLVWAFRYRSVPPEEIAHSGSPTPSVTATSSATVTPTPEQPPVTPTPSTRPSVVVAITLTPGLTLGSGQSLPTLKLPAEAEAAELKLMLYSADFTRYRAALQTGGATVWTKNALKPQTTPSGEAQVSVRIPTRQLKRADYLLLLYGDNQGSQISNSPIASYSFSVSPDNLK